MLVKTEMEIKSKLLEHVGRRILNSVKERFPEIKTAELKISKIQAKLANARIIDESKMDSSKVLLLSTVTIKNLKNKASMKYKLVPEEEADLKKGKISVESPIAKGLLGKEVGDHVEIKVPAGVIPFEVIEVTR